jgi:predicted ATPase
LVGRELERTLLTGTFERAVRDASVQLVSIVGEPGVGKSRLVAELFHFIETWPDLIRWRQGRSLPYGDAITFWALGEILKAEAGILETDSPEVAGSKIDAIVPDAHPDAPWLRQRLRPLVGLEAPPAAREENFAAWRAFLESLAEHGPSVFVFEDLHWADDALLAFIESLADYAEGVPMLVVTTARPELYERGPRLGCLRPQLEPGEPLTSHGGRRRPVSSRTSWSPRSCPPRSSRPSFSVRGAIPCTPRSSCAC